MIDTHQLPEPYRQGGLNLCAIAAFATATYPFCKRTIDDFLLDVWAIYNCGSAIPGPDALRRYYDQNAESCFESFKHKHGARLQMVHWFDFLGDMGGARSFNAVRSHCELRMNLTIDDFSIGLKDEVAVGCIGIAVRCKNSGRDLAHYINVWFDGNEFCMRDSRSGGGSPVDGRANSVPMILSNCELFTEYSMIDSWRVLVGPRNEQKAAPGLNELPPQARTRK